MTSNKVDNNALASLVGGCTSVNASRVGIGTLIDSTMIEVQLNEEKNE